MEIAHSVLNIYFQFSHCYGLYWDQARLARRSIWLFI